MPSIELGVPGQIMPPVDKAVDLARRNESDGFDAVWWPDHLMGWHPDSMWTEDLTDLAKYQPNPHQYFDPLMMMGAIGSQTGCGAGRCGRDRPHSSPPRGTRPDHAHGGSPHARDGASSGSGRGERLNITPYGMEFNKPVGRLEEGIKIIRMLWEAEGKVSYEGEHFKLDDAVCGLFPYEGKATRDLDRGARAPNAADHRRERGRLVADQGCDRRVRPYGGDHSSGGRGRGTGHGSIHARHARLRARRSPTRKRWSA